MSHASRIIATLVLLVSIMLCALTLALASPAQAADPSIRVACDYYAINRVDPIVLGSGHLHRQFGNTSTSDSSTYESLYANKGTSCNAPWWTNAGWFPIERFEEAAKADVYYRCPGKQTQCSDIPKGAQLIAHYDEDGISYNCGAGPGDTAPYQATPVYSCNNNWTTQVRFPACWDGLGVTPEHFVYSTVGRQGCQNNLKRLPEISILITHPNTDGKVPNPLTVSCGEDLWCPFTSMHGDYYFAAQDEFHNDVDLDGDGNLEGVNGTYNGGYSEEALINLCIRDAPDIEFNDDRCRAGGLKDWHKKAIRDYYGRYF